jgi:hypothetical protein
MTAIVHELMDSSALNQRSGSLLGANKINGQQKQEPAKDRPRQNFLQRDSGDGDRLWSECTGYRLSHSKTSGIMRPKADFALRNEERSGFHSGATAPELHRLLRFIPKTNVTLWL